MELVFLAIGIALGAVIVYRWGPRRTATTVADPAGPAAPEPAAEPAPAASPDDPRARAIAMGQALDDVYQRAERGEDLEQEPRFAELVQFLAGPDFGPSHRVAWMTSQTMPLSCAALAAMQRAGDTVYDDVARIMGRLGYFPFYFALAFLRGSEDPAIAGLVLLRINDWSADYPGTRESLGRYLDHLKARGIVPAVSEQAAGLDWTFEARREVLGQHAHPLIDDFLAQLEQVDRRRRGQQELARVGRTLDAAPGADVYAYTQTLRDRVDQLHEMLQRPGRPSLVLVGDSGVGKTALAREALRGLLGAGWRVLEASPSQLLAGQQYIGQMEQRIESLVAGLQGERALWFVPDWPQLLEQGRASGNRTSLLDRVMPYVERGQLQVLGEATPEAYARVATQAPRVQGLFTALKVDSLGDDEMRALGRDWADRQRQRLGAEVTDAAMLDEAFELARQQYPQHAEPGRSLQLLGDALAGATAATPHDLPITREALLAALAARSGLPLDLLDSRRRLDVETVRAFLARRVIGQDEAVDCLLDRISMLKAGLTDPRRPIGVFLFAGPTGTGKTELAKALAEYLFGSPDRMLRVDMSEYQSEDSAWRLLGDSQGDGGDTLTARVRQNPFSVLLLDEFEKAHPRIWDLFLQVFDDGRLSDRSGKTADFRHCIIVLTSNLGATIDRGGAAGFLSTRGGFSRDAVQRTIDATFRREFVNRLDRVVVFQPLSRALMREILAKELRAVLGRRGFRGRDWAVEWESSAIEFLLDRGFTPDLGARPLRRAIDQHLLAPLARTIVEHRVPSGEQFLFVQSDGESLQVRFVDPDADAAPAPDSAAAANGPVDLRALALDPRTGAETHALLGRAIEATRARVDSAPWQAMKAAHAGEMQLPGFWQRPDRQGLLDRLERIDRVEAGLRATEALEARLARGTGRSGADLVRRLALQVRMLDLGVEALLADQAEDACIDLRPADARAGAALAWRDALVRMYQAWGQARGVRVQVEATDANSGTVRLQAAGLGAWQVLGGETGLHVLEGRTSGDARQSVRVTVSPVSAGNDAPAATAADGDSRVCRRYEEGAAPLVRDLVRGWRSGRADRVLGGDFDLF